MKRLLIVGFFVYWGALFLNTFYLYDKPYNLNSFENRIFPGNYRFFSGSIYTSIDTDYKFFKEKKLIKTINLSSYYSRKSSQEFPFSNKSFNEYFFYTNKYNALGLFLFSEKEKPLPLSYNILKENPDVKVVFTNLENLHKEILDNNKIKGATSVDVSVYFSPPIAPIVGDYKYANISTNIYTKTISIEK